MRKKIFMSPKGSLTLASAANNFIKRAEIRNLSPNTIKTYRCHFGLFCKCIPETTELIDISRDTLDEFVFWAKKNLDANDTTINSYLRTLRSFLYFCMDEGYLDQFKISLLKTEKKVKETYTKAELDKLMKKPDVKTCGFNEFRVWALENYLLGTGNRISTALALKIRDIDFDSGTIILRKTKNRKQQIIPLSSSLAKVMREYLAVRGGGPDDFVFCTVYGDEGSRRVFQAAVAAYNRRRGVEKTSCHVFRHTFAKEWILAGGDMFRLQKILGHSDLTVTREYVNMFGADLSIGFDQFNPLDNLTGSKQKIEMTRK